MEDLLDEAVLLERLDRAIPDKDVLLAAAGLPPVPAGKAYQLWAIAGTRPDDECLVFRDRRLTWHAVTDRTRRLANHPDVRIVAAALDRVAKTQEPEELSLFCTTIAWWLLRRLRGLGFRVYWPSWVMCSVPLPGLDRYLPTHPVRLL